jgi:hypothetical protein
MLQLLHNAKVHLEGKLGVQTDEFPSLGSRQDNHQALLAKPGYMTSSLYMSYKCRYATLPFKNSPLSSQLQYPPGSPYLVSRSYQCPTPQSIAHAHAQFTPYSHQTPYSMWRPRQLKTLIRKVTQPDNVCASSSMNVQRIQLAATSSASVLFTRCVVREQGHKPISSTVCKTLPSTVRRSSPQKKRRTGTVEDKHVVSFQLPKIRLMRAGKTPLQCLT